MKWFKKQGERRVQPRHKKRISVEIHRHPCQVSRVTDDLTASWLGGEASGKALSGRDISLGGLCFLSDKPLAADAMLSMTIRISAVKEMERRLLAAAGVRKIPIRAEARVKWCRFDEAVECYAVGVSFVNIFEDDRKLLTRFLAAQQ